MLPQFEGTRAAIRDQGGLGWGSTTSLENFRRQVMERRAAVEKLREMGHEVYAFSDHHFRVDGVFDFWYPRGMWHDIVTGERGNKPLEQMPFFVHNRLEDRPVEIGKQDFIKTLIDIGWSKEEAEESWREKTSPVKSFGQ
jgi:hypothetical protein